MCIRAVALAAFSLAPSHTFGNAANLIDDVRNPSFRTDNFALIKKTSFREGLGLEYRLDMQNVFNHNLFGNINTTLGDPGFGHATGTMLQPRIIQMTLRLGFQAFSDAAARRR